MEIRRFKLLAKSINAGLTCSLVVGKFVIIMLFGKHLFSWVDTYYR